MASFLLTQLFSDHSCHEILSDEDITSYIMSMAAELESKDDLPDLIAVIDCFLEGFSDWTDANAIAEKIYDMNHNHGQGTDEKENDSPAVDSPVPDASPVDAHPDLSPLFAMFPTVNCSAISHLYLKSDKDTNAAAEALLNYTTINSYRARVDDEIAKGDAKRETDRLKSARKQIATVTSKPAAPPAQESVDQAIRSSILARFDEESELIADTRKMKVGDAKKQERRASRKMKEEKDGVNKLRFRDSEVVSKSGGKHIIEKVGEEWDGGSRGRVKSKGKRGAGWTG